MEEALGPRQAEVLDHSHSNKGSARLLKALGLGLHRVLGGLGPVLVPLVVVQVALGHLSRGKGGLGPFVVGLAAARLEGLGARALQGLEPANPAKVACLVLPATGSALAQQLAEALGLAAICLGPFKMKVMPICRTMGLMHQAEASLSQQHSASAQGHLASLSPSLLDLAVTSSSNSRRKVLPPSHKKGQALGLGVAQALGSLSSRCMALAPLA
ncbi:unnamed protein product [Chrysoparadoxa australica]